MPKIQESTIAALCDADFNTTTEVKKFRSRYTLEDCENAYNSQDN